MIHSIALLSNIPVIDKYITVRISKLKHVEKYTRQFSMAIIYFNIGFNIYLWGYIPSNILYLRYCIELLLVNVMLKYLLDRPRPKHSLLTTGKYYPIYKIRITKNWRKKQSFPSGHVTTVYCTYYLLNMLDFPAWTWIYFFLLFLTIFARINTGAHHFSDCIWAILICQYAFKYLMPMTIYVE